MSDTGAISIGLSVYLVIYSTRILSKRQISQHSYAKIRPLKNTQKKDLFLNLLVHTGLESMF